MRVEVTGSAEQYLRGLRRARRATRALRSELARAFRLAMWRRKRRAGVG
jgi:hypothetical protein